MCEIVTLLNLTLFIYNIYTWLIVVDSLRHKRLFVNAPYEWNVTKANSYLHLNVIGEQISLYPCITRVLVPLYILQALKHWKLWRCKAD